MKRLSELIAALDDKRTSGALDLGIGGISTDSRSTRSGDLFVALRGTSHDGHDYVRDAVERGAAAVVAERRPPEARVPFVVVENSAKALAELSSRFFDDPADRLFLCGITGTDGKTSTAHIYRSIVRASGWGKIGILGTLGHGADEKLTRTPHTTPDAFELHRQFKKMVEKECRGVVMEVSSHAVRQHRIWGLDFDVGILTNVTHDHLDYHPTIDDYRAAKAEFCFALGGDRRKKKPGTLVYSNDDPVARGIGERFDGSKISVGATDQADVYTSAVEISLTGTRFRLHFGRDETVDVNMKLLGAFSAVNAAFAAGGARATGIGSDAVKAGLESIERVAGRFESLGGGGKPVVVLDYCHTPDALARVLKTCRKLNPRRLTTVFGCGGDRDRSKRPEMGRIAQELSDFCYITMDNPRSEAVETIVEDILAGMDRGASDFVVDLNRSRAVRDAIGNAGGGDLVALLGKGPEDYQIVGEDRIPYSDRSEAEGALREWQPH